MALMLACTHENLLLKTQLDSTKNLEDPYKPQVKDGSRYKMSRASSSEITSKFKHRETLIDQTQASRISKILFSKCETIVSQNPVFKKNKLFGKRIFDNCMEIVNIGSGVIMSRRNSATKKDEQVHMSATYTPLVPVRKMLPIRKSQKSINQSTGISVNLQNILPIIGQETPQTAELFTRKPLGIAQQQTEYIEDHQINTQIQIMKDIGLSMIDPNSARSNS